MSGHVFICQGDLTRLACDAWLLPSNESLIVQPYWITPELQELGIRHSESSCLQKPPGWGNDGVRVTAIDTWSEAVNLPRPWITNVGGQPETPVAWYLEGARQFFARVQPELAGKRYLPVRCRPLLALPLVGTGLGGGMHRRGEIIGKLLELCRNVAEQTGCDIVLVTHSQTDYVAAQNVRLRHAASPEEGRARLWPELDATLADQGRELARKAIAGKLVMFLGAGVSAGGGLPMWSALLGRLAEEAGFSDSQRRALQSFSFLDQAEIIRKELALKGIAMNDRIAADIGNVKSYALAHALLASLPTNEVVTQNYDTMFETACRAAGQELSVIPYRSRPNSPKWLLKMHGCVTRPDDIVLSRVDYLDYDYTRSALSGIVQALLITRHMLFLGFSLTDDHFIQLIFGVQKAVHDMQTGEVDPSGDGKQRRPAIFGSIVLPKRDALMEELWENELQFINMTGEDGDFAVAARRYDIFLDFVCAHATPTSQFLMNDDFTPILTAEEKLVRDELRVFQSRIPHAVRATPVWNRVEEFLASLGEELPTRTA
jgi:hypothetical protein